MGPGHPASRRLDLPHDGIGGAPFGHLYAFSPCEIVIYLGGAISEAEYERRRASTPDAVAEEYVAAAAGRQRDSRPSLLVLSLPPWWGPDVRPRRLELGRELVAGFLAAARACPPEVGGASVDQVSGLVGNSLGAHFALGLLPHLPAVRTIACLAGVGMCEALDGAGQIESVAIHAAVNLDDPVRHHTEALGAWCVDRDIPVDLDLGPGGHAFEDYRLRGAVRRAFEAVLAGRNG